MAEGFGTGPIMELHISKGSKYATSISSLSYYPKEGEVLLLPYTLLSTRRDNRGGFGITLRELHTTDW